MLLDTITRNEEQLINTVNYLVNYIGQDKIINIFNLKSRKHDIKRRSNDLYEIITFPKMDSLSINYSKDAKSGHIGICNLLNGKYKFVWSDLFFNTFEIEKNEILLNLLSLTYMAYDNNTNRLTNLYFKAQNHYSGKDESIFNKYNYFNALGQYLGYGIAFNSTWFYYFENAKYSEIPELVNYKHVKMDNGYSFIFNGPEKNIQLEDVIAWLDDYEKLLNLSVLYYRKIGIEVDL